MSKEYVCNVCKKVIKDPYAAKMKEFYYSADYFYGFVVPGKTRTKEKIHLCDTCFGVLRLLSNKRKSSEKRECRCEQLFSVKKLVVVLNTLVEALQDEIGADTAKQLKALTEEVWEDCWCREEGIK